MTQKVSLTFLSVMV